MERKEFIKSCGLACLGATSMVTWLQSCIPAKNITAIIEDDQLVVPKTDFRKKDSYYNYIIVNHSRLQFPIALFRFATDAYSALYLQCSHQGNELNAFGDKLVCPAHGSEFDNKGNVTHGPATDPLRSFPIQIENNNILISLKSA
ncbi:MAG TPA: Rieske (2Fe-2S) protein [Arenibacter sp.]|nr:Rieske (2Fe-2S) protein [Arenibacter sp.]